MKMARSIFRSSLRICAVERARLGAKFKGQGGKRPGCKGTGVGAPAASCRRVAGALWCPAVEGA